MADLDIFGDNRKTPKLSINVKIKVKPEFQEYNGSWNKVFGYIMKKPRTKLEFLAVNAFRNISLNELVLEDIKDYISEMDYNQLKKVEIVFNKGLTTDVKAFILAILKVPFNKVDEIVKSRLESN